MRKITPIEYERMETVFLREMKLVENPQGDLTEWYTAKQDEFREKMKNEGYYVGILLEE